MAHDFYILPTGQLHKGRPGSGIFLHFNTEHEKELPIPRKPYTFGAVVDAQAKGDFQALLASGRRVFNVNLINKNAFDIKQITDKLLIG